MKKQILGAAIASLIAANANALTVDPTTTTTLVISGASAQRGYFKQLLNVGTADKTKNICAGPVTWFSDNSGTQAAPTEGKNYDAWYCAKEPTNPDLANAKANLLIYKRSAGGSDLGVAPIITPAPLGQLDIASPTCTTPAAVAGTNASVSYCSPATLNNTLTPDLGVSDVDPSQFVGKNVSAGFQAVKSSDLTNLNIQSTSAVVFGEQVTAHLYNALQAVQIANGSLASTCSLAANSHTEACMPSLSSATIANIHAGKVKDWDQIIVDGTGLGLFSWAAANSAANAPATSNVHVVRRVNGSGTQTQHGIVFLNYPCDLAASTTTLAVNDAVTQTEGVGGLVVHEMSAAGDVNAVLTALDAHTASTLVNTLGSSTPTGNQYIGGARWAVGLNSLEQKTSATTNFEFVKVDGVAPTLANVVNGKYKDWVENTFQYNTTRAVAADVVAARNAIINDAATPAVLASLNGSLTHLFGNGAYLAHPSNPAVIGHVIPATVNVPVASSGAPYVYDSTFPATPFSRTPAGAKTDNCRAPTTYYDGTNTFPTLGM